MPTKNDIEDFLAQRRIAFVGVSRDPKQFANRICHALKQKGYQLYPVNPHAEQMDGERCYSGVANLPEPVDGALIMVPPRAATEVVRQCADAGIRRVWLGRGVESPEAVSYCREHGIVVVDGACPMMFAEPVGFAHACHRFLVGLTEGLPK